MKSIFVSFLVLFATISVAGELDIASLLKRDLNEQIKFISRNEIRYCPDNTCVIYKSVSSSKNLAAYVYLHIIHESIYTPIYRKKFIQAAKESDVVLNQFSSFCTSKKVSPSCVLGGLAKELEIKQCFGRYDEGYYCYGCNESENICTKI